MYQFARTHKALIVSGLVLLLVLITGITLYFVFPKGRTQSLKFADVIGIGNVLEISPIAQSFQVAQILNTKTGALTNVKAVGQGLASVLSFGKQENSTEAYYILDLSKGTSNLFKQDTKKPETGLFQLTFSNTHKYDLSYDAVSGSATYVVQVDKKTDHIFFYSPISKKEIDLGQGTEPTILNGGFFVVFRDGKNIVSENVTNQKRYTLLNIDAGAPFAVDQIAATIALYIPQVKSVQYFSIATKVSGSYQKSIKLNSTPVALVFAGSKLLYVTAIPQGNATDFSIGLVDAQTAVFLMHTVVPEHMYRISIQHE